MANGTFGNDNTCIGRGAMYNNHGNRNTALGRLAMSGDGNNTTNDNTAVGYEALQNIKGSNNTAIGTGALKNINGTAVSNVAIGHNAGLNHTGTDSNNIDIKNDGIAGDNDTIRIGNTHTRNFQAGIFGVNVIGGSQVIIDANGQLGVAVSARKYKENIKDMTIESENIYKLKPKTFTLKNDNNKEIQYGLIADEVNEVFPRLVRKENGEIEGLHDKYLPYLLLNEIIKLKSEFKSEINELKSEINVLKAKLI